MVVPKYTMAGYTVMMKEITDQIQKEKITCVSFAVRVKSSSVKKAYVRECVGHSPAIPTPSIPFGQPASASMLDLTSFFVMPLYSPG